METNNRDLHEVAITAIIVKDGGSTGASSEPQPNSSPEPKYLITRRSLNKKRFPGMWTVPGGKMEASDYLKLPKDTEHYWYNVLEQTLRREVKEEVGIDIDNIEYITSLATVHTDGSPSLVIACMADYVGGEIKLQAEENDQFAWVNLEESKNYQLLDGIYDELVMVENKRKGKKSEWQRF
ncbi:MAG: NUDIX domain-containing protein [Patescibacteria group bacterium]